MFFISSFVVRSWWRRNYVYLKDGPNPAIVMEFCGGGSLDRILFNPNIQISEAYRWRLIAGIARGYNSHSHLSFHSLLFVFLCLWMLSNEIWKEQNSEMWIMCLWCLFVCLLLLWMLWRNVSSSSKQYHSSWFGSS